MLHIYVAAKYARKKEAAEFMTRINHNPGLTCVSTWADRSNRYDFPLDIAMELEAADDLDDLDTADVLVLLSDVDRDLGIPDPALGGGKHVEFGYALGSEDMEIIVLGAKENIFHYLRKIEVVQTEEEVIERLKEIRDAQGRP